jgi:hypothetical protein
VFRPFQPTLPSASGTVPNQACDLADEKSHGNPGRGEKATDIGAYIISEKVVEAFTRFQRRQRLDPNNSANIEIYEDQYRAYAKVLAEIKKLAKEDLGV